MRASAPDLDLIIRLTEPVCLCNIVVTGTIRVDDVYLTGACFRGITINNAPSPNI